MHKRPKPAPPISTWRTAGSGDPQGCWRVDTESEIELALEFDGDPEGDLPTVTLRRAQSHGGFRLSYHLEFAITLNSDDLSEFSALLTQASAWTVHTSGFKIVLLETTERGDAGGAIVLANDKEFDCVHWLASSHGEDYTVHYEVSRETVKSVSEMVAYVTAWSSKL
jgi:hypothetical protein